jgi:hypothetical protein
MCPESLHLQKDGAVRFLSQAAGVQEGVVHEFESLVTVSGIEGEFKAARRADPVLDVNWRNVAEDWSPDSRYESSSKQEAEDLLAAISDPDHGVFSCIKRLW